MFVQSHTTIPINLHITIPIIPIFPHCHISIFHDHYSSLLSLPTSFTTFLIFYTQKTPHLDHSSTQRSLRKESELLKQRVSSKIRLQSLMQHCGCNPDAVRKSKENLLILWSLPVYSFQTHKSNVLLIRVGPFVFEVGSVTRGNINLLPKENIPKVASEANEMVQIIGELNVACNALFQVILRLKANLFGIEGATVAFPSTLLYIPIVKHVKWFRIWKSYLVLSGNHMFHCFDHRE